MMETLLATLERESEGEIARVMEEARARAADLTAAAEQRMAERRARTLGQRELEARAQLERALAAARRAARTRVLTTRGELLERVFTTLSAELPALSRSAPYRAGLAPRLERLLRFAGEQAVTVRCSPAVASVLRAAVKTNGRLRIQSDSRIGAGFRLATADATLEVDATLEGRLERMRPRLAVEALRELSQ